MAVFYQYRPKFLIQLLLASGLVLAFALVAAPETLDRVVASVGNAAITASEVEQEYRFERFLDGQWPPPQPAAGVLDHVREQLTYRLLLNSEETPTPEELAECEKVAKGRLAELQKAFSHPGDFHAALDDLGMTEAQAVTRVAQQELLLRMIEERLRPAASPSEEDVTDYYHGTFVPEFQKKNPGAAPPPLSEVEAQIRQVLTEKRVNELLDQWIEELKPTSRVRVHSF